MKNCLKNYQKLNKTDFTAEFEELDEMLRPKENPKETPKVKQEIPPKAIAKAPKTKEDKKAQRKHRHYKHHDVKSEQEIIEKLSNVREIKNGVAFNLGKNNKIRFKKLLPTIIQTLNKIVKGHETKRTGYDHWYFKYHVRNNNWKQWTTLPLNSENIKRINDFLNGNTTFEKTNEELENEKLVDLRDLMVKLFSVL